MATVVTNGIGRAPNGVGTSKGRLINPVYGKLKSEKIENIAVTSSVTEKYQVQRAAADDTDTARAPLRTVHPPFVLEDRPIDQYSVITAAIIGAGISGITAATLLQAKVPGLEFVIFEKNAEVGGVWNTSLYPGASADEYSDVYQSTFAPKTKWSADYAPAREIKDYWQSLANQYRLQSKIRFNHEVTEARWSEQNAKWQVSVRYNGSTRTEYTDFLITATGLFKDSRFPDIPGVSNFLGELRQASDWDLNSDLAGKRVALIGNDLTALQLLPQLQKLVKQVVHYKGPSNLIPVPVDTDSNLFNYAPQDPKGYTKFRKELESKSYTKFATTMKDSPPSNWDQKTTPDILKENIQGKTIQLDPSRTSGSSISYLQALTQPNVTYVTSPIKHISRKGIVTTDDTYYEIDTIFFAESTSASSYSPTFPILGPTDLNPPLDNNFDAPATNLQKKWQPPGYPDTYLGLAAPEYPNFFFLLGANSSGPGSTTSYSVERQATYIAKVFRKVRMQGIRTITPSLEATRDFRAYLESFFPTTVLSDANTAAWYNGNVFGGRILALWPGSGVHASIARRDPRWEDYIYTYKNSQANRFAYLGNGWSVKDVIAANLGERTADKVGFAGYLREDAVGGGADLKALHEEWWE